MSWLLLVSLIWAFSFGLIKDRLTGIPPSLVSFLRIVLALAVFLPFLRRREVRANDALKLAAIGAIQFGLMYVCYIAAFPYLQSYEIALLTIFTPLLVCACDDVLMQRIRLWPWVAAVIATVGAGVVLFGHALNFGAWKGILLVQASNACFAIGQVAYRKWKIRHSGVQDAHVFAFLYLGAAIATGISAAPAFHALSAITTNQWLTLVYLGVVASGLGFFLWNFGAARTAPGPLAVANNIKIPLAVACSVFLFDEPANLPRLLLGAALVTLAGVLATRKAHA